MERINLTPLSTVVDEVWGKEGTPKRDAMEKQLNGEIISSYSLGETVLPFGNLGKVALW